jgi:hypothetical protein
MADNPKQEKPLYITSVMIIEWHLGSLALIIHYVPWWAYAYVKITRNLLILIHVTMLIHWLCNLLGHVGQTATISLSLTAARPIIIMWQSRCVGLQCGVCAALGVTSGGAGGQLPPVDNLAPPSCPPCGISGFDMPGREQRKLCILLL